VPVLAVLLVLRHPAARALAAGTGVAGLLAVIAALLTSRPYLASIAGSLLPLVAGLVVLALVCGVLVRLARTGRLARRRGLTSPRLGPVLAGALALVLLVLASRPLWLVVRQDPADSGSKLVAALQQAQGLRIDGGRTYAEHSIDWIAWYSGWPLVALAGAGAVVALLRLVPALQGRTPLPPWFAPYVIAIGSTLLTLYRPGITPDHPWADRRFVVVVLPAVVVFAIAAIAWITARLPAAVARVLPVREPGDRVVPMVAVVVLAVLVVLPAVLATAPVAAQRTERGEVAAVERACSSFAAGDVAIAVDSRARNEWPQVLRGTCGVPSASIVVSTAVGAIGSPQYLATLTAAIERESARVRLAGHTPVLVAAGGAADAVQTLRGLGVADPRVVSDLRTAEDERVLEERPDGVQFIDVRLVTGLAP
ncbi:MAG: hypothetical protein ACRYF3_13835, partial [Janthinobacterium lividum]